jgi:hypothetical protein
MLVHGGLESKFALHCDHTEDSNRSFIFSPRTKIHDFINIALQDDDLAFFLVWSVAQSLCRQGRPYLRVSSINRLTHERRRSTRVIRFKTSGKCRPAGAWNLL